ncbi:MAG TPA: hypothetical protein VGF67_24535 [Ktedonobacteraceae bacterium]
MQELKAAYISHLLVQPGIVACLLRKYSDLRTRVGAWLVGEKPILLIGGEPGNGKSLLMGDLVSQHRALAKIYPGLQTPPALISYDRVHYLFLKHLHERSTPHPHCFLPEGETHPQARQYITGILQDALLFTMQQLPAHTPIALEAPLIGHRGEEIIATLKRLGYGSQIFIMHSPAMWAQILYNPRLLTRTTSASALAMRQIHEDLLQQRALSQAGDSALKESWEHWLQDHEGMVLAWHPLEDEADFLYTRHMLQAMQFPSDPLYPDILQEYTISCINRILDLQPDIYAFARNIQNYQR